jgi:hypothetical protein
MKCKLLWLLAFLAPQVSGAQTTPTLTEYAGQYVMRLDQRNLIVLSLELKDANLDGVLKRPRGFGGNVRIRVMNATTATYRVTSATLGADHLKLVVQNTEKASDTDVWDLTLLDSTHASLGVDDPGFAIEPLPLLRVAAQPQQVVSSIWESNRTYGVDDGAVSSATMAHIYDEDQKPRQGGQGTCFEA